MYVNTFESSIRKESSFIRNLTFINNYSELNGAGMYLLDLNNITISNIKFLNNSVNPNKPLPGGTAIYAISIKNMLF